MPSGHSLWKRWFWCGAGEPEPGWRVQLVHYILLLILLGLATTYIFSRLTYNWNWQSVQPYSELFLIGWWKTVQISACALVLSCLLGLLVAVGQRCPLLPLRILCRLYVEIVRGSPLLVQILILYYGVFEIFGLNNAFFAGVLILSLFAGAYIGEMFRAGIEAVGKSQWESARAVGFTRWQCYRHVILPQAIRQTLPPLAGQFASLVKDSSLLSIVSIREMTLSAQDINSITYSPFESYLPLAFGYLLLTIPISMVSRALERKFHYET